MAAAMSFRPERATRTALVIGDDAAAGRRAARLLEQAGFACTPDEPDLIVLLAAGDAGERVAQLRAAAELRAGARVIAAMPGDASGAMLRKALHAGAAGIVFDGELEQTLCATAHAVGAGQLVVPLALRRHVAPRALSFREKQVLGLVVQGLTNRQIAARLFLAESTVKTHLSSAFDKLETRSRAEAAALVLDPEEGYGMEMFDPARLQQDTAA
jgi:DNA-binding NarL/FixJ family response regulator